MSGNPLQAAMGGLGKELGELAEEHFKHDLRQSDRDALRSASSTAVTHIAIGTATGVALGIFFAYRARANRWRMFQSFRAHDQPTHIKFANGHEEPLPDITPMIRPSKIGGFATYTFFGFTGLFIGGQLGGATGTFSAKRQIAADRESRDRISTAIRRFRADALRAQAKTLDNAGESGGEYGL